MKFKGLIWAMVMMLILGPGGIGAAAPNTDSIYPREDPQRMAQSGPGYDQEGTQAGMQAEVEESDAAEEGQEAETAGTGKPPAPGRGFVWVNAYRLSDGALIPGFWRPRRMAGFRWVAGAWKASLGIYVPGYWRPAKMTKRGYVWAPGYWHAGRWFPGMWRPAARRGFVWTPAHWTRNGEWVFGHWRPSGPAPSGKIWVPGLYNHRGVWVPGHWRSTARPGLRWIPGRYNRQGAWMRGHWRRQASDRPAPNKPGRGRGHNRGPRR